MTFSLLVFATLVNGLLIGLVPTLVDGLKAPLQARLNLAEGRSEWFVSLFYFAWLPGMPLAGWALDYWPSKEILFYSLVVLILALAWLAHVQSLRAACANATVLGLAYAGVTTTAVHLMTRVFFPNCESNPLLTLAAFNLGFVCVGVGALLGPMMIAGIERWWGYRQGLLVLSMVCIAPAALTILSEAGEFPKPAGAAVSWQAVLDQPNLVMIVGIILLYFALENCLDFWPEPYLRELGYHARGQHVCMTLFWLGFSATRGLAAWWLYVHPTQGFGWIFVCAFLSALIVGNLAGGYEIGSGTFGFILAGAAYGPLLPGFLGMAYALCPSLPVAALGMLLALSGIDTLVVRPLMRRFTRERQPRIIMRVPALLALLLSAPLLLLAFLRD